MSATGQSEFTRKKVILVVEDDEKMNELMRIILEEAGYSVLSAYDWQTAQKILRDVRPDLALLDLILPDTTGGETCWKFGQDDAIGDIPFIVSTSMTDLPAKLSSFLAGARRFLSKPFTSTELLREVKRVLDESNPAPFWRQVAEFQNETDEYIKNIQRKIG